MPTLPARANLEHLKKQAKALLHDYQQRDPSATARFSSLGADVASDRAKLADAQHVIAREYGFASWTKLKEHVEASRAEPDPRKALIAAVEANDVAKARDLLERHAILREKINEPAPEIPFGGRPIGAVASTENREMVDLFLDFGADINARSDWAPGSWGVLDGAKPEFADFLISRGARLDAHSAAHLGKLDVLRQIVTAEPSAVHARGGDGQTPLHFARSVEVADFLLSHGADIDALDIDHEGTPAQWMIRDRTELARHLVRRGARTDFLLAVALGDVDLVRRYLDADPKRVRTIVLPEHFPTHGGHAFQHIYMWSLGRNKTAHEIAKDFGHEAVWELLMERSPDDVKLVEACRIGDDNLIADIVRKNPSLTQQLPNEAKRRLVDAAQDERLDLVKRLLAAGWPTDARGQEDGTALHWAAFLGQTEIVRELLRYGAPVDVMEHTHNGTPIHWALYGSVHGWRTQTGDFVGVVDALLGAGAQLPQPVQVASDAVRAYLSTIQPVRE